MKAVLVIFLFGVAMQ
ncbi:hypothetical protein KGM_212794A, partial [Danaus plexippus plexippus]